ncbi:MAG: ATP-binding domain-containing protein, partial [Actinobacteria bacterium]|nr:ATP-binding domain-containing protein [Actinomycetota bacterium]NIS33643.1 ATP-binding domain-containing protein [Actinomycetota bacterium]NIT96998.1 ATP-binding domain-containing protein [Actinomycetota bacterium]NIU68502.1 ATP-binding domain-containing protein [Actinomycetota bacterium]NIV88670.1 ATP-binding domain-containing protein [Actinomycetota bacterium]
LSEADAVTLITVHRAKGLEWPVVFLPAVYARNFPSRSHRYDDPFASARSIPYEWRIDRGSLPGIDATTPEKERRAALRTHHEAQEWRIAYVASTRAKEELHVTGAHWYGHPDPTRAPVEPSALFEL